MALSDIRTQFVKLSGRYDMQNTDGSDAGANWFINAGQRYIDRMLDTGKSSAKIFHTIGQGDYFAKFKECRAVQHVLLHKSDMSGRVELEKVEELALRTTYAEHPSRITQAQPKYYTPVNMRIADHRVDNADITLDLMTSDIPHEYEYNGVLFMPPSDAVYHLEIRGLFYSRKLVEDTDKNFWTEVHEDILIQAALYKLEVFYRNFSGARDFEDALARDVAGLDKDSVAQDIVDVDQMEG